VIVVTDSKVNEINETALSAMLILSKLLLTTAIVHGVSWLIEFEFLQIIVISKRRIIRKRGANTADSHAGKPAASFCDVATMRSRHGRALAAKTATNHSQDRYQT
jgi:hypothetical protein